MGPPTAQTTTQYKVFSFDLPISVSELQNSTLQMTSCQLMHGTVYVCVCVCVCMCVCVFRNVILSVLWLRVN